MTKDRVNASLEYFGVLFALHNCVVLVQDNGQVQGVSLAAIVFFTLWGVWNLYYYPSLGQHASAIASIGLVFANGAWLGIYTYFRLASGGLA